MYDSNEINMNDIRKTVFLRTLRFISKTVADILNLYTNTRIAMEFTN